jgi:4-hydroxy-tetrahydrodipicolinate synthase
VIFAPPVSDYRARTKEALKLMGIIEHTVVRPPLLDVDDAERDKIRRALQRAGML